MKRLVEARGAWWVCALLVVGTLAVYWQTGSFEFLSYDDNDYVSGNAVVRAGLTMRGMVWAFSTWETGNWIPLTWLSHMLACNYFGLNAGAHHLVNVALHAANALLLFVVLRRMTGALWRSAMVAALFAWHPLHVESVAWVSERKDVLSGLFFMLTLWAWARYAECGVRNAKCRVETTDHGPRTTDYGPRTTDHVSRFTFHVSPFNVSPFNVSPFYLLSLSFFTLGLMSKSMLVTVPFVLLLLDYWPLRRMGNDEWRMMNGESPDTHRAIRTTSTLRSIATEDGQHAPVPPSTFNSQPSTLPRLLLEKLPFFLLSAAVAVLTYIAQDQSGATRMMGYIPFSDRLANASVSYVRYLAKMIWPEGLTVLYPFPKQLPLWQVASALALLMLCSLLAGKLLRRQPWLAVGWCWFLGMLIPVIGLVQVGRQSMADRYTYLPLIGLFIALVWGGFELLLTLRLLVTRNLAPGVRPSPGAATIGSSDVPEGSNASGGACVAAPGDGRTPGALAGVILLACAVASWAQVRYWRNSEVLWARALAVTTGNAGAHHNYGFALEQRGHLEEAMVQYREAVRIEPDLFEAQDNLGRLLCELGHPAEATNHLTQAVRIYPGSSIAQAHLGHALVALGDWAGARDHYEAALAAAPNDPAVPADWGKALLAQGRAREALERFNQALQLAPDYRPARGGSAFALVEIAAGLASEGKRGEAVQQYRQALQGQPDLPEVLNNLAWLLATAKEPEIRNGAEAVRLAERACELTRYQQGFFVGTLAAAYAEAGRFEEARSTAQKAIAVAEAAGQSELAAKNRELLRLYKEGKPYHETELDHR